MSTGHGALMDRVYRHQRHFYDFTRRPYLFGRDTLIRRIDARQGDHVLEIGCGTARNLIKIARRFPGAHLSGIDASTEMLRSAGANIRAAHISNNVRLVEGLAESAPDLFPNERFEHVIFSYSLSMIADSRAALVACRAVLADSGRLHIVDFADLSNLWRPIPHLLKGWLRLFHVQPRVQLLQRMEQIARHRTDCTLHLLPGRYAFVFQCDSSCISELL